MKPLKNEFKEILNDISNFNFYIAGGAIACSYFEIYDEKQDLDIFFRYKSDFDRLNMYFSEISKYKEVAITTNAITYQTHSESEDELFSFDSSNTIDNVDHSKCTIQLICKSFGEPEDVIADFDINKSMIALDIKNKKLIFDERFNNPLEVYHYHAQTLNRVAKYSYRSNENYDWTYLIEKYYNNFEIDTFYDNNKINSIDVLSSFMKKCLTNFDISDNVRNDITNSLSKFSKNTEMVEFLSCIFLPYDLDTENITLQILYYKYFSKNIPKTLIDNKGNAIMPYHYKKVVELIKKYFTVIREKSPETLFF